jgi:hypothetical protein
MAVDAADQQRFAVEQQQAIFDFNRRKPISQASASISSSPRHRETTAR